MAAGALAADGWLHTGDLGRLDDEGRLEIIGRVADTIVTGGENVAPAEVEAVLVAHPAIADAAVLGRADPEWGEAWSRSSSSPRARGRPARRRAAAFLRDTAGPVQGAQAL